MKKLFVSLVALVQCALGFSQPQTIPYFIQTAPWGCGSEELVEMYSGRIVPTSDVLSHNPSLIPFFSDSDEPATFVGGYELGDYNALMTFFLPSEGAGLWSAMAIVLPTEEPAEQTYANLRGALAAELGEPSDSTPTEEDKGEGIVCLYTDMWAHENTTFSLVVVHNKYGDDEPLFYAIRLYDTQKLVDEILAAETDAILEEIEEMESNDEGEESVVPSDEATMAEFEAQMTTLEQPSNNHLHFRGVSFNQTTEEFCAELEALGYTRNHDYKPSANSSSPRAMLSGEYGGEACNIFIYVTPTTNKVFLVGLAFEEMSPWGEAWGTYNTFRRRLTNIYGEPESVEDKFALPYEMGSGLEYEGLKSGMSSFVTLFRVNNEEERGYIYIKLLPGDNAPFMSIEFYDEFNFVLREQEYESLM